MNTRFPIVLVSALVLIAASQSTTSYTSDTDQAAALSKISPWLLTQSDSYRALGFLVVLSDQADLSGAAALHTKKEKGRYVYRTLYKTARRKQRPILNWLRARHIENHPFYLVNMIWVKATSETAMALASRSDVKAIEANPVVSSQIEPPESQQLPASAATIETNITSTRAPEVWQMGYTGQGVVVAGADTGYRWDHAAIQGKYRGVNGINVDHNFNWHDSVHSGGGSCGPDSPVPCDDNGHGTHTMGTVLGDDGAGNQIGMAPGAKWIGCRNMDQGNGTPASYIECMEFFLAPYPVGGDPSQGNPDLAPDITTNSWTCPASEGCSPDSLKAAVEAQRAAGIMMVVAAGNSGPSCSTVSEPPAIYDAVYTVGAISHSTGSIAGFSSRGPVTIDGSNRLKPDITAPGVSIRSSTRSSTSSYATLSGTSMATPHVAGALALLYSAQPAMRNDLLFSESVLNNAAVGVSSTSCGSDGIPNNTYGFGRLDIKSAVDAALPCTNAPTIAQASAAVPARASNGTLSVTSLSGCGWKAMSNAAFITITGGSAGTGNGIVSYSVDQNTGSSPRSGTLTISGRTFTIYQGAAFLDVPESHPFYDQIGRISARGITAGCGGTNFCPDESVTREQMAAFIILALVGSKPPTPAEQRFNDVPPSNVFYSYIDEMAVRGITAGCGGGNYCPSSPVTREQMAAFIIRALGEFNPPKPIMQRFLDVPPENVFYADIDRMAVLGITAGCGGGNYCPQFPVTRGQMAVFLVRAFNL